MPVPKIVSLVASDGPIMVEEAVEFVMKEPKIEAPTAEAMLPRPNAEVLVAEVMLLLPKAEEEEPEAVFA